MIRPTADLSAAGIVFFPNVISFNNVFYRYKTTLYIRRRIFILKVRSYE